MIATPDDSAVVISSVSEDDEIFWGPISEKEETLLTKMCRRKTVVIDRDDIFSLQPLLVSIGEENARPKQLVNAVPSTSVASIGTTPAVNELEFTCEDKQILESYKKMAQWKIKKNGSICGKSRLRKVRASGEVDISKFELIIDKYGIDVSTSTDSRICELVTLYHTIKNALINVSEPYDDEVKSKKENILKSTVSFQSPKIMASKSPGYTIIPLTRQRKTGKPLLNSLLHWNYLKSKRDSSSSNVSPVLASREIGHKIGVASLNSKEPTSTTLKQTGLVQVSPPKKIKISDDSILTGESPLMSVGINDVDVVLTTPKLSQKPRIYPQTDGPAVKQKNESSTLGSSDYFLDCLITESVKKRLRY